MTARFAKMPLALVDCSRRTLLSKLHRVFVFIILFPNRCFVVPKENIFLFIFCVTDFSNSTLNLMATPSLEQLQALASYSRAGMMIQSRYPLFSGTMYMHMTSVALSSPNPSMVYDPMGMATFCQKPEESAAQDAEHSEDDQSIEIDTIDQDNTFDSGSVVSQENSLESASRSPVETSEAKPADDELRRSIDNSKPLTRYESSTLTHAESAEDLINDSMTLLQA